MKKTTASMKKSNSGATKAKQGNRSLPADRRRIKELGDWRGATLARVRRLIKEVCPGVVEEWKWRGVPAWEHDGIICTGDTYKAVVKPTFARGASIKDPKKLFNSSLEGNARRAIDIREGRRSTKPPLRSWSALRRRPIPQRAPNGRPRRNKPDSRARRVACAIVNFFQPNVNGSLPTIAASRLPAGGGAEVSVASIGSEHAPRPVWRRSWRVSSWRISSANFLAHLLAQLLAFVVFGPVGRRDQ